MIIKKYQGKTEEEAMIFAKKELGEGVVLMNVKNMGSKTAEEVMACVRNNLGRVIWK